MPDHLAALTMYRTTRCGRLNVVQIARIVCVILTLCLKLEQLLSVCRRVSSDHGRLRVPDWRALVERLVGGCEVWCDHAMRVTSVLTVNL